jgi:hypothetical protein
VEVVDLEGGARPRRRMEVQERLAVPAVLFETESERARVLVFFFFLGQCRRNVACNILPIYVVVVVVVSEF